MLRDSGLAHPQPLDQVADGLLLLPEQVKDPPPRRIHHHLEHRYHEGKNA
jgi:hypothetical protein